MCVCVCVQKFHWSSTKKCFPLVVLVSAGAHRPLNPPPPQRVRRRQTGHADPTKRSKRTWAGPHARTVESVLQPEAQHPVGTGGHQALQAGHAPAGQELHHLPGRHTGRPVSGGFLYQPGPTAQNGKYVYATTTTTTTSVTGTAPHTAGVNLAMRRRLAWENWRERGGLRTREHTTQRRASLQYQVDHINRSSPVTRSQAKGPGLLASW